MHIESKNKNSETNEEQVEIAHKAANGDKSARATINELIHPIITFQTNRFCKRFCHENKYRYKCTLQPPIGTAKKEAPLCEHGNASYCWMLDDLTGSKRLLQFEGKNGAPINSYLYCIANSLPFYERWKDWRFGGKVNVPTYIQELHPQGGKVFLALRSGKAIPDISQNLAISLKEAEKLAQEIVVALTQRNRLHLLNPPKTHSLTTWGNEDGENDGTERDIYSHDEEPEIKEEKLNLAKAWKKLSVTEQFVLEAMLIQEQDAEDVLFAIKKMAIVIKKGVAPSETNKQQLYYFRRKTLAKLKDFVGEEDHTTP